MDADDMIKNALRQGWREQATKKGVLLFPPDTTKPAVSWHGTPSDVRAVRNFLALMKRSGLIWPPPRK